MILNLPPSAGLAREQAIRALVADGTFDPILWSTVTSDHGEHHAEFQVFSDALKIEGIRINASAETEQHLADLLGCSLLTPKLADLIWAQKSVSLEPSIQPFDSSTAAMLAHSSRIDAALAAQGNPQGIVCNVGKHWVIDNAILSHPGFVENYGWHFEGVGFKGIRGEANVSLTKDSKGRFVRVIQGCGWQHNMAHTDYSQTVTLVSLGCTVDGQDMHLFDVFRSPELAPLVSHNGALKLVRLPGVGQ